MMGFFLSGEILNDNDNNKPATSNQLLNGCKEEVENGRKLIVMDAVRLVKLLRDNISAGRRSPGLSKRRWSDLILD
jgi:hypothetical protein